MNPASAAFAHAPGHPGSLPARIEGRGMLLALDGRCLERLALPRAVELCRGKSPYRLDILLAHPPRAAITLLGESPRVLRRLLSLRRWSHDEQETYPEVFPRSS